MTLTFISLFSGIGGFDVGFERAGLRCVAQVEKDARASAVLARHWPDVLRFEDVRDVGRHNLPPADLVCGGFPCQDVSVAGRRKGLAGERSGLWFEFLRVLKELAPRTVVIENVPGLLSSNGGRDFAVILRGLVECGYGVCWRILDAQYFGVPQRRRRVFIVGHLGDGRAAEILFERESGTGHFEPSGAARERTAGAASTSFKRRGGYGWSESRDVSPTLESQGGSHQGAPDNLPLVNVNNVFDQTGRGYWQKGAQSLAARDFKDAKNVVVGTLGAEHGRNRGLGNENETEFLVTAFTQNEREEVRELGNVAAAMVSEPGTHQQTYVAIKMDNTKSNGWGVLEDGTTHTLGGSEDAIAFGLTTSVTPKYGREVSPTLTQPSPSGGGQPPAMASLAHGVRRLTPTECTRLQGFPDDWLEGYDVDVDEAHAREVLHGMWKALGTETRSGWRFGIALSLLTPEILLAGVYGGWLSWEMAARCASERGALSGANAWAENFVRLLWEYAEYRPPPYRQESFEQLARELDRPLQELPLEGSQARAFVQRSGMWPEASAEWTLRPPFTAAEARRSSHLSDSTRYRQLGNAVAVPVISWLGRRIAEVYG